MLIGTIRSFVTAYTVITRPAVRREVVMHDLSAALTDREIDAIVEGVLQCIPRGAQIPVVELVCAIEKELYAQHGV